MPCGPTYKCQLSSYEATLTFLALGGRHTDSADSYTDAEPGIGLAMREWIAADPANNQRSELFIASKIGPGGACWPLGYNESIAQAKMIIGYYNQLPSPMPTTNITQLDLLLIHWPVNFGPCSIGKLPGIPTTDPLCNGTLPSYDEKACRISTWRGMVAAMQMGLTRSIDVSNFNSTEMQDLKDAGLPLPAANQISWSPGIVPKLFGPYSHTETSKSLQAWYVCITINHTAAAASAFFKQENKASSILPSSTQDSDQNSCAPCGRAHRCVKNNVLVNGYSPFGGNGHAGQTFSNPSIQAVAAAHSVSPAQAVLRWNVQQNIPVIPMATDPDYQAENLDIFGFTLTEQEMECLSTLNASVCPPPPPPPPPTPAQTKCEFTLAGRSIALKALPAGPFALKDRLGDKYLVVCVCTLYTSEIGAKPMCLSLCCVALRCAVSP